jgi:hypothetical protein
MPRGAWNTIGRIGEAGITLSPVIRRADESHAQVVHGIMSAIPWSSEAARSGDGFVKLKEFCARGEVFILMTNSIIVSMMILRKTADSASESSGT